MSKYNNFRNLTNSDEIQIQNSSSFDASGGKVRIDDEIIQYSSIKIYIV